MVLLSPEGIEKRGNTTTGNPYLDRSILLSQLFHYVFFIVILVLCSQMSTMGLEVTTSIDFTFGM